MIQGNIPHPLSVDQIDDVLFDMWKRVLHIESFNADHDFFEIGGNRELAQEILEEIKNELGLHFPYIFIKNNPTLSKLKNSIIEFTSCKHLLGIQPMGSRYPFFCVPPSLSQGEILEPIARKLDHNQPFYGLLFSGVDGVSVPHESIREMAEYNIAAMRIIQPEGPYLLGGMCFGGIVAFEMAQQLYQEGSEIALLAIMDSSYAPKQHKSLEYYMFGVRTLINSIMFQGKRPLRIPGTRERLEVRVKENDELIDKLVQLASNHAIARAKYLSDPYPGKITFFSTQRRIAERLKSMWQEATLQPMDIIPIAGTHGSSRRGEFIEESQFMGGPNLDILIQKLGECLDEVNKKL